MIILTKCENEFIADEYCAALEAEGVVCRLEDETLIYPLGGTNYVINLLVDPNDAERAHAIVDRVDEARNSQRSCPECDSRDVAEITTWCGLRMKCNACGYEF